jgi:1,4-dihydroxy-2-naphthoate octaprenyltransferase
LLAALLFSSVLVIEMIIAALVGPKQPWIWMLLLSVPLLGLLLEFQQTRLKRAVAALLEEVASGLKLVKLPLSNPGLQKPPRTPARAGRSLVINTSQPVANR